MCVANGDWRPDPVRVGLEQPILPDIWDNQKETAQANYTDKAANPCRHFQKAPGRVQGEESHASRFHGYAITSRPSSIGRSEFERHPNLFRLRPHLSTGFLLSFCRHLLVPTPICLIIAPYCIFISWNCPFMDYCRVGMSLFPSPNISKNFFWLSNISKNYLYLLLYYYM